MLQAHRRELRRRKRRAAAARAAAELELALGDLYLALEPLFVELAMHRADPDAPAVLYPSQVHALLNRLRRLAETLRTTA